jgi:hypothetical protein
VSIAGTAAAAAPARQSVRAQLGGKVLGAPGQSAQPSACAGISAGKEQSGRGFGRQRDNFDVTVRQAVHRFAHRKLSVGMDDGDAAFSFRQHDGVGLRRYYDIEIGVGEAGL